MWLSIILFFMLSFSFSVQAKTNDVCENEVLPLETIKTVRFIHKSLTRSDWPLANIEYIDLNLIDIKNLLLQSKEKNIKSCIIKNDSYYQEPVLTFELWPNQSFNLEKYQIYTDNSNVFYDSIVITDVNTIITKEGRVFENRSNEAFLSLSLEDTLKNLNNTTNFGGRRWANVSKDTNLVLLSDVPLGKDSILLRDFKKIVEKNKNIVLIQNKKNYLLNYQLFLQQWSELEKSPLPLSFNKLEGYKEINLEEIRNTISFGPVKCEAEQNLLNCSSMFNIHKDKLLFILGIGFLFLLIVFTGYLWVRKYHVKNNE